MHGTMKYRIAGFLGRKNSHCLGNIRIPVSCVTPHNRDISWNYVNAINIR